MSKKVMNKDIALFIYKNNLEYIKMLLENADLDLEPLRVESGIEQDHYCDNKKGIFARLDSDHKKSKIVIGNAMHSEKDGDYHVGISEYLEKEIDIDFSYFGLSNNIQIMVIDGRIDVKYMCENEFYQQRIYYDVNEDRIMLDPSDGETHEVSDATVDNLINIIKGFYQEATSTINDKECVENKFELIVPILKEAIYRKFANFWDERLANWKNSQNDNIIENNMGCIIEEEDCTYDDCNPEKGIIGYKNDELVIEGKNIYTDESIMDINFTDELSNSERNRVRVIKIFDNFDGVRIKFIFDFKDGKRLRIVVNNDKDIKFYTPSKGLVECALGRHSKLLIDSRYNDIIMFWNEQITEYRDNFGLCEEGIEYLIDKIYDAVKDDYTSPKFERLFNLIRPALFQTILRMGVQGVADLYKAVKSRREEIEEIDNDMADIIANNPDKAIPQSTKKLNLLSEIEILEYKIDEVQHLLYEESMKSKTNKKIKA